MHTIIISMFYFQGSAVITTGEKAELNDGECSLQDRWSNAYERPQELKHKALNPSTTEPSQLLFHYLGKMLEGMSNAPCKVLKVKELFGIIYTYL